MIDLSSLYGKDNYTSWSFAIDGVTKDAITSEGILDFVSGDNITITRSDDDKITISGSAGVSNHSELDELDYVSAGHTGFQPAGDYATDSELTTLSGALKNDIDGKSDIGHLHDDRYYTETELNNGQLDNIYYTESETDTISGSLQTNIDGKSDTGHTHDDRYYTETELDAGQLDNRYYIESEIDTISGSLNTKIDGKADSIHIHDDRYYTESEVDLLITTFSGTIDHNTINNTHNLTTDIDHNQTTNYQIGEHRVINDSSSESTDLWSAEKIENRVVTATGTLTQDHSGLDSLDYASSGHTGFQPAGDYLTDSEFSTYSGTLQSQIDGKSDTSHLHDDRYYTESEVDTISGSLSAEIDSDISTHLSSGDHDDRYYTETEVDTISGSLSAEIDSDISTHEAGDSHDSRYYTETELNNGQLDTRYYTETEVDDLITAVSGTTDHSVLDNLDYASSGHTGFQPSGNYATDSELTTLSGALKNDIDGKADTVHAHDDLYYTENEVDTISGSLNSIISILQSDFTTHSGTSNIHTELDDTVSGTENLWSADKIISHTNTVTSGIGSGLTWEVISSDTNAINSHGYLINASGNAVTLTLPDSPNEGDSIGACDIYNKSSTNIITLARNGNNIEGVVEDLIIDTDGAGFTLVYADVTRGWEIVSEIGGAGYSVSDEVYSEDWNELTNVAPSKNVLYDKMETKSDIGHLHNDLYYTETEVDTLIATFSGTSTVGLSDDVWVQIDDADAVDNDYAKFTASGIEGRNYSEVLSDLSGQASSAFDWNDQIISRPEIKDYSETKTAPTSLSNVLTLDIVNGNVFSTLLTENVTTLNFSNPSPTGKACSFTWIMTQHSTAVSVAWPVSVNWDSGTAPTITADGGVYTFVFVTYDAGTTWFGFLAGSEMAVPA